MREGDGISSWKRTKRNAYIAARWIVEWGKEGCTVVVRVVETEKGRESARASERGKAGRRYGAKAVRVVRPAGQSCCGGNHDA